MKNIHLIQTDKPSRIYLVKSNNKLGITSNNPEYTQNFGSGTQNQHIYITSDEEIKEGDWFFNGEHILQCSDVTDIIIDTEGQWSTIEDCKKIILTTDQDLIKDGVQAISDEFLEWFVKNPGCESVEVEDYYNPTNMVYGINTSPYKIIIPQEEPKRKIDTCYNFDMEIGCVQDICRCEQEEPKQETLEEAAENYVRNEFDTTLKLISKYSFTDGAKWQADRMYTEEEVVELLNFVSKEYNISNGIGWFHTHKSIEDVSSKEVLDKWFEQFKKK